MIRIKRGFAAMTPEKLQRVAQKGGRKSAALGAGHRFTTEEATAAAKKGGGRPKKQKLP